MRSNLIILLPPLLNQYLCLSQRGKYLSVQHSSLSLSLKLSIYPFSQGLPGSMNNVLTPRVNGHTGPISKTFALGGAGGRGANTFQPQKAQILAVALRRIGNLASVALQSSLALADGQASPVSRRGTPGRAWARWLRARFYLGY